MFTIIFLFLFLILFLLMLPFILLGTYLFHSFVVYRLAKQTGVSNPGYAWIPVVQAWVLGTCAEECEQRCGDKRHKWGKILLICKIVHLAAMVLFLPIGILLAFFGGGLVAQVVTWAAAAYTVVELVCTYKIYHYYLSDPADIVLTLVHTQFGFSMLGLLIVSFLQPRGGKKNIHDAAYAEQGESVVIGAEEGK